MLSNYLKIAFRNLQRQKAHSVINITGLAIGLTCSMLILMWVLDELSFDLYHERSHDIYRVLENQHYTGGQIFPVAVTPSAMAGALKREFPEIIRSTRFSYRSITIKHGDALFTEGTAFADPDIFDIFTIPFLEGNPQTALSNPHSIVLTEQTAKKYFGDQDPLDKVLRVDNQHDFIVTGVIKNIPENSHLQYDMLASFLYLGERGSSLENWSSNWCYTYVLLQPNTSPSLVNAKIADIIQRHTESTTDAFLQPLSEIHLYSSGKYAVDVSGMGDIEYVRMFFAVAIFILLIGCVNFMNLATARSERRAKEVGLRKVIGAHRSQLIGQFLSESIVVTLIAFLLALGGTELLLPTFNDLSGKALTLNKLGLSAGLAFLGVALIVGVISGSYPALLLSAYRPVETLKGGRNTNRGGSSFRKVLVVVQFTLSIMMIIGTLAVSRQIGYLRHKNLGLNKDNLGYVWMAGTFREKENIAKQELLKDPDITSVTVTSQLPTYVASSRSGWDWDGKPADVDVLMHYVSVDCDYARTFQMEMTNGRFFSPEFATDSAAAVINETAAEAMGMHSPIGKRLSLGKNTFTIIGVVKDFHFKPLQTKIEPLVLLMAPDRYYAMVMRLNAGGISGAIAHVEEVYKHFNPQTPFHFNFLDEDYDNLYKAEERIGTITATFAIMAIFIACLGLYGLASYVAEQRTKEIGIRKVLGATVPTLFLLLSMDFVVLTGIANIIAWPAAYIVMSNWLQNYAYHVSLDAGVFFLAAGLAFSIVLFTVSYQAIRAALANPVDALRYE